jgi:molybdate-binding protein
MDMKKSPLTSGSPIINVTAGFTEFYDDNYKIIVDADVNSTQRAKDIIKSLGGKFENERESIGRTNEDIGELNRTFKDNQI